MPPPPLPYSPSWMVNRRIGGGQRGEEYKSEESTQDLQHSRQESVQGNVITDDKEKLDFLTPLAWPRNWRVMWWAHQTHCRFPLCLLHFWWAISKPFIVQTRHSFGLNNSERQQSARRLRPELESSSASRYLPDPEKRSYYLPMNKNIIYLGKLPLTKIRLHEKHLKQACHKSYFTEKETEARGKPMLAQSGIQFNVSRDGLRIRLQAAKPMFLIPILLPWM